MSDLNLELNNQSPLKLVLQGKEVLDIKLKEPVSTGTRDYVKLRNKPTINGVELVGELTTELLGIVSENTTAGWKSMITYVPKSGEVVIYTDYKVATLADGSTVNIPGIKIGDGNSYVVDLPFANDMSSAVVLEELDKHIKDTTIHVTQAEKDFWNAKLNYDIDNEELILTRN